MSVSPAARRPLQINRRRTNNTIETVATTSTSTTEAPSNNATDAHSSNSNNLSTTLTLNPDIYTRPANEEQLIFGMWISLFEVVKVSDLHKHNLQVHMRNEVLMPRRNQNN